MLKATSTAILISACPAMAQEGTSRISGEMSCDVTSNNVLEVKDGRPISYTGYLDAFEVGDTLAFNYEFRSQSDVLEMGLEDYQRDLHVSLKVFDGSITPRINENSTVAVYDNNVLGGGSFGLDYIRLHDVFYDIRLRRYYRSDWQGIGSSFTGDAVHTFTVDCRTVGADNIQTAFEAIRSVASERTAGTE